MAKLRTVHDVARYQLCTGCGVCAYLAPQEIRMADVATHGRRPLPITPINSGSPTDTGKTSATNSSDAAEALQCCPGATLGHDTDAPAPGEIAQLRPMWGPVRAIWEGYAADPEIRFAGSSGGVITALATFCVEQAGMSGVLHTAARTDVPYLNKTQFSRTRAELLAATGSRYAPASPCERLDLIEQADGPAVFVGKPCDVAAAQMAARARPQLAERLGLSIAFFCAGTPSTQGTLQMMAELGVDPADATSVRYRGLGWPGRARVTAVGDPPDHDRSLSYEQSWGEILQRHRQWRCYLCADHTGEFADVAVGDPWHRSTEDDPGRSLVLARTERGAQILAAAIDAGVLTLTPASPKALPDSQPNLVQARGAVLGRIVTLRMASQAAPRFRNLPMLSAWWHHLSLVEKLRSTLGTLRRVVRRRLWRPVTLSEYDPMSTVRASAPAPDEEK